MQINAKPSPHIIDALVVGAGPTGLAAATASSRAGITTALVTPAAIEGPPDVTHQDTRTAALFPPSLTFLASLGVDIDEDLAAEPLRAIRIVDCTGGLLRAPEVTFRPEEIGATTFGANVAQSALVPALAEAARSAGVSFLERRHVVALRPEADWVEAELDDATRIRAKLIIAADGRESVCRSEAGISARRWTYDQVAIATRFEHQRPHHGISTELHRIAGPCTTVPMPGNASSLVWVEKPDVAAQLIECPERSFLDRLEGHFCGMLWPLSKLGPRRAFPLSGLIATTMARNRIALVGEAAHVIPPIGAQGLNLGLADVASLADYISKAARAGQDIGSPAILQSYASKRLKEIATKINAVDIMNRTLTGSILFPIALARGFGLHAIAAIPALRRRLIREGLAPASQLPSLMQTSQHAPNSTK